MKILIFLLFAPPVISALFGLIVQNYMLLFNSVYTLLCLGLISFIYLKFKWLSFGTYISFLVFILLSVFAGRCLNVYHFIPHWDKLLHFYSGTILSFAGKNVFLKLSPQNTNQKTAKLFSLLFSLAAASLWEIYEFSGDRLFGFNSQNASLDDTMWDIILGSIGGVIAVYILPQLKKPILNK